MLPMVLEIGRVRWREVLPSLECRAMERQEVRFNTMRRLVLLDDGTGNDDVQRFVQRHQSTVESAIVCTAESQTIRRIQSLVVGRSPPRKDMARNQQRCEPSGLLGTQAAKRARMAVVGHYATSEHALSSTCERLSENLRRPARHCLVQRFAFIFDAR